MREKLLQLLCRHNWSEMASIYRKNPNNKGVVITPYVCEKCGKYKERKGYIR